jgi:hypothetical protein
MQDHLFCKLTVDQRHSFILKLLGKRVQGLAALIAQSRNVPSFKQGDNYLTISGDQHYPYIFAATIQFATTKTSLGGEHAIPLLESELRATAPIRRHVRLRPPGDPPHDPPTEQTESDTACVKLLNLISRSSSISEHADQHHRNQSTPEESPASISAEQCSQPGRPRANADPTIKKPRHEVHAA